MIITGSLSRLLSRTYSFAGRLSCNKYTLQDPSYPNLLNTSRGVKYTNSIILSGSNIKTNWISYKSRKFTLRNKFFVDIACIHSQPLILNPTTIPVHSNTIPQMTTSISNSKEVEEAPNGFETRILKVNPEDIYYPEHDSTVKLPVIDETSETFKNLEIAVKTLTTTDYPVAFPTETVYGLGASGLRSAASKNIYRAKNRPADNPLILHISALDQLKRILHTDLPEIYKPLVDKFWPGPLTIILPVPPPIPSSSSSPLSNNGESQGENYNVNNGNKHTEAIDLLHPVISPVCTHGQSTFAVRMPNHPVARALIALADTPLAAPSANASTRPSPTKASHVYGDLKGRIPLILDGGSCSVGVESTVVDGTVNPPKLLRPGGISLEQIREFGGKMWENVIVGPANIPLKSLSVKKTEEKQGSESKTITVEVNSDTNQNQQKQSSAAAATAADDYIPRTPGMKYKHYSPSCPVYLYINCENGVSAIEQTFLQSKEINFQDPQKIALLTTRKFDSELIQKKLLNISSSSLSSSSLSPNNEHKIEVIIHSLGIKGSEISRNLFDQLREMDEIQHATYILVEGIGLENEGLAVMNRLSKAASHIFHGLLKNNSSNSNNNDNDGNINYNIDIIQEK